MVLTGLSFRALSCSVLRLSPFSFPSALLLLKPTPLPANSSTSFSSIGLGGSAAVEMRRRNGGGALRGSLGEWEEAEMKKGRIFGGGLWRWRRRRRKKKEGGGAAAAAEKEKRGLKEERRGGIFFGPSTP